MQHEASFGIIPLQYIDNVCHVLLIKHRSGNHWSFPKGHANAGESPLETAQRELYEETGLSVASLLDTAPLMESYQLMRKEGLTDKTVTYFPAFVAGNLSLQSEELLDYKWVKVADAESYVTYPESKRICKLLLKYNL